MVFAHYDYRPVLYTTMDSFICKQPTHNPCCDWDQNQDAGGSVTPTHSMAASCRSPSAIA